MNARRRTMSLGRHVDALLAYLAGILMPDAYREGGKLVAFAAGFFVSFVIVEL